MARNSRRGRTPARAAKRRLGWIGNAGTINDLSDGISDTSGAAFTLIAGDIETNVNGIGGDAFNLKRIVGDVIITPAGDSEDLFLNTTWFVCIAVLDIGEGDFASQPIDLILQDEIVLWHTLINVRQRSSLLVAGAGTVLAHATGGTEHAHVDTKSNRKLGKDTSVVLFARALSSETPLGNTFDVDFALRCLVALP